MLATAPPLIPSYGQGFNRFAAAPGLEGLWCPSLGPTGAVLYDQGPHKCHGVLTAMAPTTDWVSESPWGWVLEYDGVNDQVVIPHKQNLTIGLSDFTIQGWVRLNGPSTDRGPSLICQGGIGAGQWVFRVFNADAVNQANRQVQFTADAGGILITAAPGSMPFDTWVHLAVTRIAALATLYQDSAVAATDNTAGSNLNSVLDWNIGGIGGRWWKGPIGNMAYFHRCLPQNEIIRHMHDPHYLLREVE